MTLQIFTARLRDYRGPDRLDITRLGAEEAARLGQDVWPGAAMAPSRRLLDWGRAQMGGSFESQTAVFSAYSAAYVEEMKASWRANHASWAQVLGRRRVVLCCYCKTACVCHRSVAARLLVKAGRGQAIYCGELAPAGTIGALTLHAEWAWTFCKALGKDAENRPTVFPSLVGRWIALHGGNSIGGKARPKSGRWSDFHVEAVACMIQTAETAGATLPERFRRAGRLAQCDQIMDEGRGIVALAHVIDAGPVKPPGGRWRFGPCAYGFGQVEPLRHPLPCDGKQGLWSLDAAQVRAVADLLPSSAAAALGYMAMAVEQLDVVYD